MTPDQFNDKWDDYLEEGHYGLAIGSEPVIKFLDEEAMPVLTQIPGFTYSQIKTKFDGVRFYTSLPWWMISGIESYIKRLLVEDDEVQNPYFQSS